MTKNKFIKELEKKLNILEETELNETLSEYKNIIDEKIAAGKTEKEAVEDFGSIDELAEEILKAYKINTKKLNKEDNEIDSFEDGIKIAATKLADLTRDMFKSGTNLTVETVFEIIIKFILLLIALAILRLPFELIKGLGSGILSFNLYPVDQILSFIWNLIVAIGYFITCAIIFIIVFKEYFNQDIKNEIKQEIKKETKKKEINKENDRPEILKILTLALKVFIIIAFIIPLYFIQVGLGIGTLILVYYAFKGLPFIGLIILTIGLGTIFDWMSDMLMQIVKGFKSFKTYKITIAILLISFGLFLSAGDIMKIEYIQEMPKNAYVEEMFEEDIYIDKPVSLNYYDEVTKEINDEFENGKVKIKITYNKEFSNIVGITLLDDEEEYYLEETIKNSNEFEKSKKIYNQFLKDLKKNKIYDYSLLNNKTIKIIANEETMRLIEE